MARAFYFEDVSNFLNNSEKEIFGHLSFNDEYGTQDTQKEAWKYEIPILKRQRNYF